MEQIEQQFELKDELSMTQNALREQISRTIEMMAERNAARHMYEEAHLLLQSIYQEAELCNSAGVRLQLVQWLMQKTAAFKDSGINDTTQI